MITAESGGQLLAAFSTVFLILAVGFLVQRLRPFSQETLTALAWLVVDILLPIFLFSAIATSSTPEALAATPLLILTGAGTVLLSLLLALALGRLAQVRLGQKPVFRFGAMVSNTSFLGIPLCAALFGMSGAVFAVLFDFGATLVGLTFGIWVLTGGHRTDWRALLLNPLILSVLAGLAWAFTGWDLPEWVARPCATLGAATLPMALLVAGAQLGSIRSSLRGQWRPVAALVALRLVLVPLIVAAALRLANPEALFAGVVLVESAMPVGLITAILARRYGEDADLAAAAILCSTLALGITLPLLVVLLL